MARSRSPGDRRTTLADVAARAGVSRATASRALAGDERITVATRAAVRDAAEALEYVPDLTARSLRARRTKALGLLLADLSDPVHGQVAAGFELVAAEAGYTVIIVAAHGDPVAERRALTAFVERSTDGICVASSAMDPSQIRDRVGRTPLSFIQPDHDALITSSSDLPDGTIRTDDADGVQQAVRHLLAVGRRDIAYLGSGDRATNRARRATAEQTLLEAADRVMRTWQVVEDAWTTPDAIAEVVGPELPEGIVCYDDKTALALLDGLRARGVRVPDDVAVVGFDDIPFAALANPRLTTVWTPTVEMGRLGAGSLIGSIGSGELPAPRILDVTLTVRESSGPRTGTDHGAPEGQAGSTEPSPGTMVAGS